MIIVTGAAGFIGSNMIRKLNEENFNAIIAVDDFNRPEKKPNLKDLTLKASVDRKDFAQWLDANYEEVEFIFHLGARTDTAEFDRELLWQLNTEYSKNIWHQCCQYQIPLIYASSAATYGLGELGYDDRHELIKNLKPLNPYGESKNAFDKWALEQVEKPFYWCGLKFFNVYGPHEDHKGRMASVIWHAYHQIKQSGGMKLFRSHHPDFRDGEQKRDFVYVGDVVEVMYWLMHHRRNPGIYNLGSGKARTFLDLVRSVFSAMGLPEKISFIDTPVDIRDKYQYFTEAKMEKLEQIGYKQKFHTLEEGVELYVKNYLLTLNR
jgi:ADP-L-glycero-D-manno-heptose 6-epimerase